MLKTPAPCFCFQSSRDEARRIAQDVVGSCPLGWASQIVPTRKADSAAWLTSSSLGSRALIFDDDEVVQLLRAAVEREGSQVAFARRHGIDRTYLNQVLKGKRRATEAVVKALGLRKVYTAKLWRHRARWTE
jgi:DNA-binding phage protein